jgi:hypothetical protein
MAQKSCTTNRLEFLEKVSCTVESGESMDVVSLDFAKAFDNVPNKRLLVKLIKWNGYVLRWIENWLANRKQRVALNGQ